MKPKHIPPSFAELLFLTHTCVVRSAAAAQSPSCMVEHSTMPSDCDMQGFPPKASLHPFERALLLLTLGPGRYERCLLGVDQLRKALLEVRCIGGSNDGKIVAKKGEKPAWLPGRGSAA